MVYTQVLAMNLIGWLAIVIWTAAICLPMFGLLKLCKMLRVEEDIEMKGVYSFMILYSSF